VIHGGPAILADVEHRCRTIAGSRFHTARFPRVPFLFSPVRYPLQSIRIIVAKSVASFGIFTGLCGFALVGCNKDTSAAATGKVGTVAIVDLDEVSKSVGWTTDIEDDRKAAEGEVNREFQVLVESVRKAWVDKRNAIGAAAHLKDDQLKILNADSVNGDDFQKLPLSKEQKDDFLRSANEAAQFVQVSKQQAQQTLQQREGRVLDGYREAIKPSVRRVANDKGFTVVVPPQSVFYFDPTVDLSNLVVDDLRKQMPQVTKPAMPKMSYQEFKFGTVTAPPSAAAAPTPPAPVSPAPVAAVPSHTTTTDTSH
jgi:Skp family chaperone for outer membrane proteins